MPGESLQQASKNASINEADLRTRKYRSAAARTALRAAIMHLAEPAHGRSAEHPQDTATAGAGLTLRARIVLLAADGRGRARSPG